MKIISDEVKKAVLDYVKNLPPYRRGQLKGNPRGTTHSNSLTQIAKKFGVDRHSVANWLRGGTSERRKQTYRNWQKERIQKHKQILVDFLGGCCYECGYSGNLGALDFHHKDPSQKVAEVSQLLLGNFEKAADEARKCVLLCCRCHREQHANGFSEASPYASETLGGVGHREGAGLEKTGALSKK